ncbi:MAG: phosphoribosylglycinamide formyltransferase [Verrucomicrobiales bacterium]
MASRQVHVDLGAYGSRSALARRLEGNLRPAAGIRANIVALAGFMRILKEPVLTEFAGRLLNIHPSLLPKFPGLGAWRQALEAGDSESGCTVHLVDAGIDSGEILAQARVPILPGDTAESLHARIQEQEHRLFPKVIGDFGARLKAAQ